MIEFIVSHLKIQNLHKVNFKSATFMSINKRNIQITLKDIEI